MPAPSTKCPACQDDVQYWQAHCRCGNFIGFPNYRSAEAERAVLTTRYEAAKRDAIQRGVEILLNKLEALSNDALPAIGMPFSACDDILRPGKYRNYHERINSGERDPALAENHSIREMIEARLYPTYQKHLHYAALSPSGKGLSNYGAVAVRWQVQNEYLGRRISLLEENSFTFFDRHHLGDRHKEIPLGYQSIWDDRAKLAVAKLVGQLTTATGSENLADLLLREEKNREEDIFIEIAIYAEDGIDTRDVVAVALQSNPTAPEDRHRWEIVQEACTKRKIALT